MDSSLRLLSRLVITQCEVQDGSYCLLSHLYMVGYWVGRLGCLAEYIF